MSVIALVGSVTLVLQEATLKKLLLPLVALAAGTLLGGALFHMIPASVNKLGNNIGIYVWIIVGFTGFFGSRAVSPLAPLPSYTERAPAVDLSNFDRRRNS
ncbi:MAG: zupT [Deltaproteobacteria bacterium]|nr:zupT [Deltaproteobacteria bacterium]